MSRSRYRIFDDAFPHFLTCTIVGWLPVFTRPDAVEIVLDSWRFLQNNRGLDLFGYVILENHLHWVAAAPDLANVVKSFKMFTARSIIDLLEGSRAETLLRQLRAHKLAHKNDSDYQVWHEGSHPQQISATEVLVQKLEYAHNNPVKRGYVDEPTDWRYSSARNYAGRPGLIEIVTEWR
jgi:REP element-mobilizing transposase RayT